MSLRAGANWEHVDTLVDRQINAESRHVWPFANSLPIDVRFLIMDRRHEVPKHQPDHFEVVVFESGEMGYEVEDRACTLHKNDVLVVGDRIHHRCRSLGDSQREARSVVLSFLPQLVHSGAPAGDDLQYLMPFTVLDSSVPNVIPARSGVSREVLDFVERIREELAAGGETSGLAIRTYLKMILLALADYYATASEARAALARRQSDARKLEPVLEHISRHYDGPIRVNDAARLCAMSACCFMHLFKDMTGHSFVAYLNRFRVTKAQDLLVATSKTISEISQETGYCNQSYFGVIFRRITGMTPYEYRRRYDGFR
jgi:AraC-like DNA-binding protein/mannose-6-phosphate isomerase-like protein (cupin superfamily)